MSQSSDSTSPFSRRKKTRLVKVGNVEIGSGRPIAIQSMAATKTQNIDATVNQIRLLTKAGADIIRVAVDSKADVIALAEIRQRTSELDTTISVDLQENYRLVKDIAPYIDKVRYNPGHLHHHEKTKSIKYVGTKGNNDICKYLIKDTMMF